MKMVMANQLKEKYPDYWQAVERSVYEDLSILFDGTDDELIKVAAFNAAFYATYELHKR